LIIQNLHRYFLYLALVFIVILAHDAWNALWWPSATGAGPYDYPSTRATRFGVGVGTLVLSINVLLLGGYTLGCHSLRHLVGGRIDCMSTTPNRRTAYRCVSCLNRRHMVWAWMSLFWVGFTDLYVRMCSMGVWSDWRIIG
jgi:hypothetical protein